MPVPIPLLDFLYGANGVFSDNISLKQIKSFGVCHLLLILQEVVKLANKLFT